MPQPRRGILARTGARISDYLRSTMPSTSGTALFEPPRTETRRPAYVADRRTAEQRTADAASEEQARQTRLGEHTKLAQQGVFGGGMGGYVAPPDEIAAQQEGADLRARFSPAQWRDVARRGAEYAGKVNAQAVAARDAGNADEAERLHQHAEDMARKAYNAQLLADGAQEADTFGAVALSSLLGIVNDPYKGQRRNLRELREEPRLTPTPEEQTALLGKNLPVSTERNPDLSRDVGAGLVGSLPVFVAGGMAGRAALGAIGELAAGEEAWAAARAARRGGSLADIMGPTPRLGRVARIADALTREIETTGIYGPKQAGIAGLREAGANFVENLGPLSMRGATEGQVVGAVQAARMAQQEGSDPITAAGMAALGGIPLGLMGELGGGLASRVFGVADRSVAGALDRVIEKVDRWRGLDRALKTRMEKIGDTQPVDRRALASMDAGADVAGKTPVSDKTLEGQRVELAKALETALAAKEQAANFGSDVGLIERDPSYLSPRPEQAEPDVPLRSALDVARERAGMPEPRDEVNAAVQMQRAAEESRLAEEQMRAEADQLRVEQAAQARDAERMGPRTLAETFARAAEDRDAGEPLAAEYHDAISKFADAQARMADATAAGDDGQPRQASAKLKLDYARARATLNEMRRKYGAQTGAAALAMLAQHDSDLSDEEKQWLGIGGALALSTAPMSRELADRALKALEGTTHPRTRAEWLELLSNEGVVLGDHYEHVNTALRNWGDDEPIYPASVRTIIENIREKEPEPGTALATVQPIPAKFVSRLERAVETLQGKAWDSPRPVADWIGKLKGTNTFSKAEFALIEPKLQELLKSKAKVDREGMLGLIAERSPNIERVTYGSPDYQPREHEPNGVDADEITDVGDLTPDMGREALEQEIDNRRAAIQRQQEEIDEITEEARRDMDSAESDLVRAEERLREHLQENFGESDWERGLDEATQYLRERVEAEYVPRGAVDTAFEKLREEAGLYTIDEPIDPNDAGLDVEELEDGTWQVTDGRGTVVGEGPTRGEALADANGRGEYDWGGDLPMLPEGFTVEQERVPEDASPYRTRWRVDRGGELLKQGFVNREIAEVGEEALRQRIREMFGDDVTITDITTPRPEGHEPMRWVILDGEGHRYSTSNPDQDRADFIDEIIGSRFEPKHSESALDEIHGMLDRYADELANYQRAESEHYWATEGERFEHELEQIDTWRSEISDIEEMIANAPDQAVARIEGGDVDVEAAEPTDPYLAPVPRKLTDSAKFSSYQRIGGGTEYVEHLNVWTNNPGERFTAGHWRTPDTVSHVRMETHTVMDTPGLSSEKVEYFPGEPEVARVTRSRIDEARQKRAKVEQELAQIARDYEALPEDEKQSSRAHDMAARYQNLSNQIKTLADRETQLEQQLRAEIPGTLPSPKRVRVMIESQSDLAQHASEYGVRRTFTPEQIAAHHAAMQPLLEREGHNNAERHRLEQQATNLNEQWRDLRREAVDAGRATRYDIGDIWNYTAEDDGSGGALADRLAHISAINPKFAELAREYNPVRDELTRLGNEYNEIRQQQREVERQFPITNSHSAVPASPFTETKVVHALNAARGLMDAAEGGYDTFAWSDGPNRVRNAHLPIAAATLTYDQLLKSAVKSMLAIAGFKDVKIEHTYIRGFGHWQIRLTPEMRAAIRKNGLPVLGVLGAMAVPSGDAEAQGTSGTSNRADLYSTGVGGIAAGALVASMMASKKLRALVKENRELSRALHLDDLSGLSNKRALTRAIESVDRDPEVGWIVLDGNRFKAMNDTHGHPEGDKAIKHFGAVLREVADQTGVPMRGFRAGGDEFAFAAPKEKLAEVMQAIERASPYTKGEVTTSLTGAYADTYAAADALLTSIKEQNRSGRGRFEYGQVTEASAAAAPAGRVGAGDRGGDANARTYTRRSGEGATERRVLDTDVRAIADYEPDPALVERHAATGHTAPPIVELDPSHAGSVDAFTKGITAARDASAHGAAVYVYSPEEYATMRLFVSPTGKTGFALKGHDIVSVFSTEKGGRAAHALAIEAGGKTLDAFDTVLPAIYASNGMRVVSRLPWDDSQAPPDWNYQTFAKFKNGRPDVVFMVHDPAFTGDRLAGTMASSYDEAVEMQQAALAKRSGPGVTLYSNPIGPALAELRRAPGVAGIAAIGVIATQQDDNEYIRRAGLPIIGLAAMHAIGSRRIGAGIDNLADAIVEQLRKSRTGTTAVRAFNPSRLVPKEALTAIKKYERERARASAVASRAAERSKKLGPVGDRAVSDVLDREAWEGMAAQTPEVLAVAIEAADEIDKATKAQLAAGTLDPEDVLPNYGGPRKYAFYEVAHALADKPGRGGGPGPSPRIAKTQTRTLDIPIRDAERKLAEAHASGDAAAIKSAQEELDLAEYESAAQRVERGEIRESSYRLAAGLEKAYQNVAAAKLFETLRATPGVAHPEWVKAVDDYQAATAMARAAKRSGVQADIDAAALMVGDATQALDAIGRRYRQKGQDYVTLPDSPSYGMLRGAVVQRDVAHELEGFGKPGALSTALRQWKEIKTVFNVGTHVGNILSNVTALHVRGLPMWAQPLYYKRALADLKNYGEAAKALTEAGVMHVNAVTADGQAITSASMRSPEGLEQLLATTRPETADVIRRESEQNSEYAITEPAIERRRKQRLAKGVAVGATIGAIRGYDEDNPERMGVGALVGAGLGALAASGKGDLIRRIYGHEDNIARIAFFLHRRARGDTIEQATQAAIDALADFRTRSPALRVIGHTVSPFILYQAKAVPAFAASIIDHPYRYLSLVAAWAAINELSKREVGEVPEEDRDLRDRATWGYFFPGFTQLPITNEEGDKGATDMARYTPFGGLATGAPPGTLPDALYEGAPQVATPGGPFIDLALRAANVHPMTREPLISRDAPRNENIATLLREATDLALPSSIGFHLTQITKDYDNRDWEKLKNDLLGPVGTKPRFVRSGGPQQRARYELDRSLRDIKYKLRRELDANKNPDRDSIIIERAMERQIRAMENYDRRTNPPAKGERP